MTDLKTAEAELAEKEARLAEIKKKIETCEDRTKDTVAKSVLMLEDTLAEGRRRLESVKASGSDRMEHFTAWFEEHWDDVRERARNAWDALME